MNMSDSKNRCTKGYRCESCKAAKSCTDPAKSYIPDVRRGTRKLLSGKYGILVAILLLAIGAALYFVMNQKTPIAADADAEFHFIDVGQGDAAMVISDDSVVVIDCGRASSSDVLTEYIRKYTDKIDCLVISHPHEDHMGGMAALINEFEIGEIIMEGYDEFEQEAPAFYERAYDAMVEHELYPVLAVPGDSHTYGDISLTVLSPQHDYDDTNSNSIVLLLEVDGAAAIFTGDAESAAERDILESYCSELDADILKIGHHGSSTSTSEKFYLAVSPDIAVISCGAGNTYGHPHRETRELFEKYSQEYYRTDEEGSIVLVCRDGEIVKK